MKNIWKIYTEDWRNIFKVPTAIFLSAALVLLPCIYNWVNLISVWDPYAHTQGIKIAVTSLDEGAAVQDKRINIGSEVLESLKTNTKLGWTFVGAEEALRGVEQGDYYAGILIPADFSRKIVSITEGTPEKPEVEYTVNEKINAVAPKITSAGVSSLTAQIRESFIKSASEAVLQQLSELNLKLEEQLPTIRRVEQGVFDLERMLPEIESMGQKVLAVEEKLPDIHEKAQKIPALEARIPEINQAGEAVLKLEERWPRINQAAEQVLVLQSRLPDIQRAAAKVTEIDQNFDQVGGALDTALVKAQRASEIVGAAQDALPRIGQIAADGGAFAEKLASFLQQHDGALEALAPVVKQNLILLQQAADSVTQITAALQQADIDPQPLLKAMRFAQERLVTGAAILGRTAGLFTALNTYLPSAPLADMAERLQSVSGNMQEQARLLGSIAQAVENGEQPARSLVDRLNTLSKEASSALGGVLARYDSEIVPGLAAALDKVELTAQNAAEVLRTLNAQLPNIEEMLKDAQALTQLAQEQIRALQGSLPEIRARVHESAAALQDKVNQLTDAVNAAAPFIQQDLPRVEQRVHQAADFVRSDLPGVEEELRVLSSFVQNRLPEIEEGVRRTAGLVRSDLPGLEAAVRRAADKIREVEGQNNLSELAKFLRGDIERQSDFLANPVLIKEVRKYPIPNYGSAMSPFYAVLSLWVGATLLISLLRVDVEDPDGQYRGYERYFGRLLTFLTVGLLQAVCMTLGDVFLLGAYVVNPLWFVLFAILVSKVFITITYTLLSVFGNTGKGIAILFLVVQFSSSGGTFPISTASAFFQAVNPFVPFTYAISLMREAVGGILLQTVIRDVLCLCIFIGLSYLLALALKKPLSGLTRRAAEKARETKVIS